MYDTVNVVPTCPLKAHFNYTITDFDVDETILPAYMPKSNFRAGMYLHTKGFQSTSVLAEGRIVKAN
ncbi:uncharacterized protein LOC128864972 [Anastrepha ludens]|uniref:uncharacterized protein LOC128864972 n=1 Tax=Anastrepha ludens TaxID=28586 RepID=UPI0023B18C24|nr:uncharacterized protein LOC128864972 [Anastrepha ludens]